VEEDGDVRRFQRDVFIGLASVYSFDEFSEFFLRAEGIGFDGSRIAKAFGASLGDGFAGLFRHYFMTLNLLIKFADFVIFCEAFFDLAEHAYHVFLGCW